MAAAQEPKPQQTTANPTEARQGRLGRPVLWVLVISTGLIAVIFAVMVGGLWGGRLARPGGQTEVDQATLNQKGGQTAPSPPKQSEAGN